MKSYRHSCLLLAFLSLPAADAMAAITCLTPDRATGSSLAVTVDDVPLAHTAQVLPLDAGGQIAPRGDAKAQARQVLANLARSLRPARSGLPKIVKLNVYLARDADRKWVQSALAEGFPGTNKPAVCFVTGALPDADALVAMDAVAVSEVKTLVKPRRPAALAALEASDIAPLAILPAGPKLYVSGMADTNSLLPATRTTLEKLVAAISHLGSKREDIVQLKVFLQPMSEVAAVRKLVADFFDGKAPPTIFVDWISANPVVEIELIAAAHGDLGKETNSLSFFTPPGTTDSKVYRRVARVNRGGLTYFSGLYGTSAGGGAVQIREIFSQLEAATKQTGSDFEHLVKATYYVTDEDASTRLNELRPQYYNPLRPPAASKAKVRGVGLAGRTVTLDMIAAGK